jgi:hypothetical protein
MNLVCVLCISLLPAQAAAQPQTGLDRPRADELRAEVTRAAKEFAAGCEFHASSAGHQPLDFVPEPILRWSNPTVGKVFGEVFLWTDRGRPAVVACWYRWFDPDWGATLEVCSLSSEGASGSQGDLRFWHTDEPGLTMADVPMAEPPALSAAARLIQMRKIAGRFSVQLDDTRNDATGVTRRLRLLSRPVFRYPAPMSDATYLDGALFAFAEATDPEAFLLLEAVENDGDLVWRYGLARMNRDALRIRDGDQVIWEVDQIEKLEGRADKPYAVFSLLRPLKAAPSVAEPQP